MHTHRISQRQELAGLLLLLSHGAWGGATYRQQGGVCVCVRACVCVSKSLNPQRLRWGHLQTAGSGVCVCVCMCV